MLIVGLHHLDRRSRLLGIVRLAIDEFDLHIARTHAVTHRIVDVQMLLAQILFARGVYVVAVGILYRVFRALQSDDLEGVLPSLSDTAMISPGRPPNFHGPTLAGISSANHAV